MNLLLYTLSVASAAAAMELPKLPVQFSASIEANIVRDQQHQMSLLVNMELQTVFKIHSITNMLVWVFLKYILLPFGLYAGQQELHDAHARVVRFFGRPRPNGYLLHALKQQQQFDLRLWWRRLLSYELHRVLVG